MQRAIYMDWNATAPMCAEARHAFVAAANSHGNASSVHSFGRQARSLVDHARAVLARLIGTRVEDIVFTSGGTEANALMLANRGGRRLIVSAVEHDSILNAADASTVRVDANGVIDLDHLRALLSGDAQPALVSVMLANNETGVIQPVAAVAKIAHEYGAVLHCDAAQAVGRIPVDLRRLDADFLSLSGHKFGAPLGIGALVVNSALQGDHSVAPLLRGGGQERNRRAGTENVPAIAGLGAAVTALELRETKTIADLRDLLEQGLLASGAAVTIFGSGVARLPNTVCFAGGSKSAETLVMALDLSGFAVSAGSACSSGKVRPSPVVTAMGFSPEAAGKAIRVSLGWSNTKADIEAFLAAWCRIQSVGGADNRMQPAA